MFKAEARRKLSVRTAATRTAKERARGGGAAGVLRDGGRERGVQRQQAGEVQRREEGGGRPAQQLGQQRQLV